MRTKNVILIVIVVVVLVVLAGMVIYNSQNSNSDTDNTTDETANNTTDENTTNNTTSNSSSSGSTSSSSSSSSNKSSGSTSDSDVSDVSYDYDVANGVESKTVDGKTYYYSEEYQDYITSDNDGDIYHMYNPDKTIDEYTDEDTGHMWGYYDGKNYDEYW